MPTYEYECQKCGHRFDRFQKMTDEPLKRCPKCRAKVKRLLGTGAGLIFKGSGFYQTDYRSKNYADAANREKSDKDSKAGKKDGSNAASSVKDSKNTTTKKE
jgi:putative FmdB family regulatory protein